MADIPQEVREAASRIADRICGCADRKQHLADIELLLAYREEAFLAGKRAGMERAAEIAEADMRSALAREYGYQPDRRLRLLAIAQAIRSEANAQTPGQE
mgnify:CR=1 FL=1